MLAAIADMQRIEELSERERASRPDVINVDGKVVAVDADGNPIDERERNTLIAMAQANADRIVKRGIERHNREVHPTQRVDMRDASLNEIESTYRQMLAGGRYRAETGQSGDPVDLGDVVQRELG
ncbi:hypothetical protein [Nocardia sp. NPDC049707]|uniref:hypothetical protein n=1 Tax=Nocardia sp. NPDC049707 TaxID=3154735 RepID=UPI0034314346